MTISRFHSYFSSWTISISIEKPRLRPKQGQKGENGWMSDKIRQDSLSENLDDLSSIFRQKLKYLVEH